MIVALKLLSLNKSLATAGSQASDEISILSQDDHRQPVQKDRLPRVDMAAIFNAEAAKNGTATPNI